MMVAILPVGAILFIGAGLLGAGTLRDLSLALFVGILDRHRRDDLHRGTACTPGCARANRELVKQASVSRTPSGRGGPPTPASASPLDQGLTAPHHERAGEP